jgi:hypothetical protein
MSEQKKLRKKKFTDRQTDRRRSVQYSTLKGPEVVHTAVRFPPYHSAMHSSTLLFRNAQFHLTIPQCTVPPYHSAMHSFTLPFRNTQFHLTEPSVSADTNLPIRTAATIQRGLPPASLHTQTQQPLYVRRNIQARSCDHCYRGKAITITYSECESVALVIQHAKRMRRIILSSGLVGLTYFPPPIS